MAVDRVQASLRGPGRPRIRERPDLRLTIRFRYHCDRDLIEILDEVRNKNEFVRRVLRHWLAEQSTAGRSCLRDVS